MERRKFVIGAGALATGSAAALGTGAFSSVEADRDIAIDVADDSDGFLGFDTIEDSPNSEAHAEVEDGLVAISITDTEEGGEGVNRDATTTFDGLFEVTNQGTQDVYVGYSGYDGGSASDLTNAGVALYQSDAENGGGLNFDNTPDQLPEIGPGESIEVGLFIFDTDAWEDEVGEDGGTVSVSLVAAEEDRLEDDYGVDPN